MGAVGTDQHHLSFLDHLPLTQDAFLYAEDRHGGQRREADGASFVLHLVEVASLLERSGYPDHVVAAAILHDILEDTDTERRELEDRFGARVAELVSAVSDDPRIEDEGEQKDEVRERVRDAGGNAAVVYAADKISKVRELRLLMTRDPGDREIETKLQRYRASLAMLERVSPDNRLVELLRFELEALEGLPPRVG